MYIILHNIFNFFLNIYVKKIEIHNNDKFILVFVIKTQAIYATDEFASVP